MTGFRLDRNGVSLYYEVHGTLCSVPARTQAWKTWRPSLCWRARTINRSSPVPTTWPPRPRGAVKHVIANAGHSSNIDQPAGFSAAVLAHAAVHGGSYVRQHLGGCDLRLVLGRADHYMISAGQQCREAVGCDLGPPTQMVNCASRLAIMLSLEPEQGANRQYDAPAGPAHANARGFSRVLFRPRPSRHGSR